MNRAHKSGRWSAVALVAAALTVALIFVGRPAIADSKIIVKMSSLAPEGTPWDDMLRAIDKEWRSLSGGQVEMKIYAGGVLGNETQIIKKMKISQIHAAMLTSVGIGDFDPGALSVQIPGVIQTYDELDYVMDRMAPILDKRVAERGFISLGWGEAGWARFFTKVPVTTPADLKAIKLYAWEGDPKMVDLFKKIDLKPVVIASTDMLPSLQTGLIEGVPTAALAALSYQWFGIANHMVDIKWSPMIGGLVVDQRTWNKIPEALRPQLLAAAQKISSDFKRKIREMDENAVAVMQKNGLTVTQPTDPAAWQKFAESTHPLLRGEIFPAEIFDQVMALHAEFQAAKKAPAAP